MLKGFLAVVLSFFQLLFPSIEITEQDDPFLNDSEFCYIQDLNLVRALSIELEAHLSQGGKLPANAELGAFFSRTINAINENGEPVAFDVDGEEIIKDSRGNRIVYEINGLYSFIIYGVGGDGIANTDDDVKLDNPPPSYIDEDLLSAYEYTPYAREAILLAGEIFTLQKIRMFNTFAQYYYFSKGKFLKIERAEEYFAKHLMGDASLKDAWGNNLIMVERYRGIEFVSAGHDGIFGINPETKKCDDLYQGDLPPTLRAIDIDALLAQVDGGE